MSAKLSESAMLISLNVLHLKTHNTDNTWCSYFAWISNPLPDKKSVTAGLTSVLWFLRWGGKKSGHVSSLASLAVARPETCFVGLDRVDNRWSGTVRYISSQSTLLGFQSHVPPAFPAYVPSVVELLTEFMNINVVGSKHSEDEIIYCCICILTLHS